MRTDFYYPSCGAGQIHGCRWAPPGAVRGVVQIVHGIAEHVERYDDFAEYLNVRGYLVVAEDHMGHGQSIGKTGTRGYFDGGWDDAVRDTAELTRRTMEEFPGLPYFIFGHSMGSFLTRTLLIRYPEWNFAGAIICGTGWQPIPKLKLGWLSCRAAARKVGEKNPSEKLQELVFGGYNRRVEHRRTEFDWLTRDSRQVDRYIADPMCGFVASSGLLRDMLGGMLYNEKKENLARMNRKLPVLFVAGSDDPVGNYGEGVRRTAKAFREAGMEQVRLKLFPLGRHEILNEINREEVFEFLFRWIESIRTK